MKVVTLGSSMKKQNAKFSYGHDYYYLKLKQLMYTAEL